MARHYAPTEKKKILDKIRIPSMKLPALPKLMDFRGFKLPKAEYKRSFSVFEMLLLLSATLIFILCVLFRFSSRIELVLLAFSALLALLPSLYRNMLRVIGRRFPDEDLLVFVGVVAAFCIGEWLGGAIAAILYRLTQILEGYISERGAAGMDLMRDKLPEKARLLIGESVQEIVPEAVVAGQILVVGTGEVVPLDGVILSGITDLDRSALTGSSAPHTCGVGDEVYSGCVNLGAEIHIRVTRSFADSTAASLLRDIENSSRYETAAERWTDRIAPLCGPVLGVLALLLAVIPSLISGDWIRWIRCAVIFLLAASPSALVITVTLSCFGAELSAFLRGIVSKGHDCLEILAQVKTMVFGKTGTITEGKFEINGVFPNRVKQDDLLSVAAAAESFSHHPIAALLKQAAGWTPESAEGVMEVEEIPGKGVSAFIEGRHVYVGNAALLDEHGISYTVPVRAGAAIHVAVENRYWGHILVGDKTREGAFDALEALRSQGVSQLVMLTGDVLSSSRPLASSLGFDLLRTELTPKGKVSAIRYLISGKGNGTSVGFVGDGFHDAPMLECADVGLAIDALHARSDADAADILLLDDDIQSLPAAMHIAKAFRRILWENFGVLLGVKLLVLILALFNVISVSVAAFCLAVSVSLSIVNCLRSFGLRY